MALGCIGSDNSNQPFSFSEVDGFGRRVVRLLDLASAKYNTLRVYLCSRDGKEVSALS